MDENPKNQYQDMRDHDLTVITVTKLEALDAKVDKFLQDTKDERERQAAICKAEDNRIDDHEKRLTKMETYFLIVAGAIPILSGVAVWLADHLTR